MKKLLITIYLLFLANLVFAATHYSATTNLQASDPLSFDSADVLTLSTPLSLANGGTGLSSASDDTTIVSNGSAWQAKSLPNCTDSSGNHLNYTTSTNAFSCGTSVGSVTVDRLTAAVTADTAIYSSNATDEFLTWSRSGSKFNLVDPVGKNILQAWPSSGTYGGLSVFGHAAVGYYDGTNPTDLSINTSVLNIIEKTNQKDWGVGIGMGLELNSDLGTSERKLADIVGLFDDGFNFTGGAGTITGLNLAYSGGSSTTVLSNGATVNMLPISFDITVPATSPAWADIYGVNIGNLAVTGGTVPTRTTGYRYSGTPNGTTNWAFRTTSGDIQLDTNGSKLIFGGNNTKGINWLVRGSTTTNILMALNSANEYDFRAASLAPVASATSKTLGLGTNQGWAGVYLQDTSATFTNKLLSTSSTALTANRTLTFDVVNASRVIKVSGDSVINQDVSTLGSPTHDSITLTGTLTSSRTTDFGWSVVSVANQACNTTCTSACIVGFDQGTPSMVGCTNATADQCLCAGAN